MLYEYLGEEYPEVLGSILGALKSIVNVIGMTKVRCLAHVGTSTLDPDNPGCGVLNCVKTNLSCVSVKWVRSWQLAVVALALFQFAICHGLPLSSEEVPLCPCGALCTVQWPTRFIALALAHSLT